MCTPQSSLYGQCVGLLDFVPSPRWWSVYECVCLPNGTCLPVQLSLPIHVSLSACLPTCVCQGMSVFVNTCKCKSDCLSVSISISLKVCLPVLVDSKKHDKRRDSKLKHPVQHIQFEPNKYHICMAISEAWYYTPWIVIIIISRSVCMHPGNAAQFGEL